MLSLSGGTVGKYIGDAIMAFWNSPNTVEGHAAAACAAALEQQELLGELRRRLAARGLPPLHARMGLSSGTVLHGNIGSRRRMEWNVIGDEVILILIWPKLSLSALIVSNC
jgi:adenylate cyclase